MAEQEPKKEGPKEKEGAAKARPAVKWDELNSFCEKTCPDLWKILGPFLKQFVKDEPPPQTPEQKAAQAKIDEGTQAKMQAAFSDKEGMNPEKFSADVSKFLQQQERDGKLKFPSDAARREFMNDVANAPYGAEKRKMVEAVAKTAVEAAKKYGVTVDMGPAAAAEKKIELTGLDANRPVQITQREMLDLTSKDNGGWMNEYKVGSDGHLVEQGNIKIADVVKNLGENPTITTLRDKGSAVDTQELVGHDDAPNASFFKLEGNGHVYYTDKQSLPGLGKDIWAKMEAAPDQGPSAKVSPPGMAQVVEARNYGTPPSLAGVG